MDKRLVRQTQSKPLVERFFTWAKHQLKHSSALPNDPWAKALNYAITRETPLKVFLSDPDIPPDTNELERALRVIPMGRKNWLFCWTELGAETLATVQSLLVSCKMCGVNPYTYLVDVLQRISTHPQSKVHELIPRLWKLKFADKPLTSLLEHAL